jgi:hypothetical protein
MFRRGLIAYLTSLALLGLGVLLFFTVLDVVGALLMGAGLLLTSVTTMYWSQVDFGAPKPFECEKCRYTRNGLTATAPCPECGVVPRERTPQERQQLINQNNLRWYGFWAGLRNKD